MNNCADVTFSSFTAHTVFIVLLIHTAGELTVFSSTKDGSVPSLREEAVSMSNV